MLAKLTAIIIQSLIVLVMFYGFTTAYAGDEIVILKSKYGNKTNVPQAKIDNIIKQKVDTALYRSIKIQAIYNKQTQPDHLLVYLSSQKYHLVYLNRINIDTEFNAISGLMKNYRLTQEDIDQQPGGSVLEAKCPDDAIEFIAFAPNNDVFEQQITLDVAEDAIAHHLKTIKLLKENATRQNYLNYMACPKLKGNFYDGDANIEEIVTVDGLISYKDINTLLRNKFRFKVTNIWLACQAYNDPIKTAIITTAQTQKYAAGINNLLVGPSDKAAACAMKAAIAGKAMQTSFDECYKLYDTPEDQWGFGGLGSDYFGT